MARNSTHRSAAIRRSPRPEPARQRSPRWPWLIILALLGAMAYFTVPRGKSESQADQPPLVGIIAGHWQYDPGATCDNGLKEIDITLPVARAVAAALRERGYRAEVLPEYADQLRGYRAAALLSIHVDSCIPELSGYKVVGSSRGVAEASAHLAGYISLAYAAATGLGFHENTITPDMTDYHAFGTIDPNTPAAIIELGFLADDADLLTNHQDRMVQGMVTGLAEFLGSRATPTPEP